MREPPEPPMTAYREGEGDEEVVGLRMMEADVEDSGLGEEQISKSSQLAQPSRGGSTSLFTGCGIVPWAGPQTECIRSAGDCEIIYDRMDLISILMPQTPPRRMRHLPCSSLKMIPVLGSITWLPQIRLIYESGQIFFFFFCVCVLFVVDGYELTVEVTLAAPPHLSTVLRWVVP